MTNMKMSFIKAQPEQISPIKQSQLPIINSYMFSSMPKKIVQNSQQILKSQRMKEHKEDYEEEEKYRTYNYDETNNVRDPNENNFQSYPQSYMQGYSPNAKKKSPAYDVTKKSGFDMY